MSHLTQRFFNALSHRELSDLRKINAHLMKERDVYLESLQHVHERAERMSAQNKELASLLPVAVAADALLRCIAEFGEGVVSGECSCSACEGHTQALDDAVAKALPLIQAERGRRFAGIGGAR